MGGSVSSNESESSSSGSSDQRVWGPQGNFLEGLYGQAQSLFGGNQMYQNQMNQMAQGLGGYNQSLMSGAQGGYQGMLGGGSVGDTSDIRNMLMDSMRSTAGGTNMGRMYGDIVGGEGNTYIDPMVDAMKQSGFQDLARAQNMGTGLAASAAGQGGSSRHAMQNAMLGESAMQNMAGNEAMLRGGAYDKDLDWKMKIAKQADLGIQNTQSNLMGMMGSANQSVNQGMGYGQGMQNLGMGSMAPWQQAAQQPWDMMNQYANVIGRPTVLSSGEQQGSGSSKGQGASVYGI